VGSTGYQHRWEQGDTACWVILHALGKLEWEAQVEWYLLAPECTSVHPDAHANDKTVQAVF